MAHAATSSRPTSILTAITVAIGGAIITGLVALWPGDMDLPKETELLRRGDLVEATTIAIERVT